MSEKGTHNHLRLVCDIADVEIPEVEVADNSSPSAEVISERKDCGRTRSINFNLPEGMAHELILARVQSELTKLSVGSNPDCSITIASRGLVSMAVYSAAKQIESVMGALPYCVSGLPNALEDVESFEAAGVEATIDRVVDDILTEANP